MEGSTFHALKGILLLLVVCSSQVSAGFTNVYPKLKAHPLKDGEDVGEPLILTPLIENGKIDDARNQSFVSLQGAERLESYSGYFTVDKTYNSNMFFWFFPALNNKENAPVVLWLQGGPGATSLFGLFTENGPLEFSKDQSLKMRKFSWNIGHNLIYIDNPVGTGYSFTDDEKGYATNERDVGKNLYIALLQFFQMFPELQKNEFFITGESYAGKYVPALSKTIKDMNINAQQKINLKGLAIGNGYTDPVNQLNYGDYLYQIGLIDAETIDTFHKHEQTAIAAIKKGDYLKAFEYMNALIDGDGPGAPSLFQNVTGFNFYYNYLHTKDDDDANSFMGEWIQSPATRKSIHVGNSTFHVEALQVEVSLANDIMQSQAATIEDLITSHKVLVYSGQLDIIVAYPLTENYLLKLKWPGRQYNTVMRKKWYVDGELAGYSRQFDNFTEVFVRNAGHMVPSDQPRWAFDMITRFTHNKPF